MLRVGIDIGSTAAKAVVIDDAKSRILSKKVMPSGWNSRRTAGDIKRWLSSVGRGKHIKDEGGLVEGNMLITATGYGRVAVPYADFTVTEITCHGKGASFLFGGGDLTVIDIGGQDTKVIVLKDGNVTDFAMNDKCSAGTGKFLEVMANRLGMTIEEFFAMAGRGNDITISSMCTVFAETEVVGMMGQGTPREDIARGCVGSVVTKVCSLVGKYAGGRNYCLTGGFCEAELIVSLLSERLGAEVRTCPDARFAGAIGAAIIKTKK